MSKFLMVRFAKFLTLLVGLATSVVLLSVPAGGQDIVATLKPWIEKNIRIGNDKNGRAQLFIRTQNVVADIRFDDFDVASEARAALAALADAFGLRHEFARPNANLFIVSSRQIADGSRPSSSLLRELGIPDSAIDIMVRTENWNSGCGVYDFSDRNGRISASIVAAETRLGANLMRACVLTGIVFSFGLRMQTKALIVPDDGYYHYLALARAIRTCSGEELGANAAASSQKIADCAARFMASQIK